MEWGALCDACHSADSEVNDAFEQSAELEEASQICDGNGETVYQETFTGYTVKVNQVLITQSQYSHDIAPKVRGASALTPEQGCEKIETIQNPNGPVWSMRSGVLAQHPNKPYIEVEKFVTTGCLKREELMADSVRSDHGSRQ